MKTNKFLVAGALIASFAIVSCNSGDQAPVVETPAADTTVLNVTIDSSVVTWKGSVLGMHSHTGTVTLTEAALRISGANVLDGSFTVNMGSITPTDSAYDAKKKGHTKADLVKHLSSNDFFAVDSNPTAKFVIDSVVANVAYGQLTVRNITNGETVQNISVNTTDSINYTVTGDLTFDRQKYGVAYASTMKDMVISNDINLTIKLVAIKQ